MDFEQWLSVGYANGWVGPPVCYTHDGLPTTTEEDDEMYEYDPCIHIMRLYLDADHKQQVENNHSPSVWRATNREL